MLEAFAIPVLNKAIDFLFTEGSKILEERRERRKAGQTLQLPVHNPAPQNTSQMKESLLHEQVSEVAWRTHEAEIQHLLSLLETYSKNYRLAREQYAKWGSELVPQIVMHRLEEAEDKVAQTIEQLQKRLSLVLGQEVIVSTE